MLHALSALNSTCASAIPPMAFFKNLVGWGHSAKGVFLKIYIFKVMRTVLLIKLHIKPIHQYQAQSRLV
jgi:hypothetical protein